MLKISQQSVCIPLLLTVYTLVVANCSGYPGVHKVCAVCILITVYTLVVANCSGYPGVHNICAVCIPLLFTLYLWTGKREAGSRLVGPCCQWGIAPDIITVIQKEKSFKFPFFSIRNKSSFHCCLCIYYFVINLVSFLHSLFYLKPLTLLRISFPMIISYLEMFVLIPRFNLEIVVSLPYTFLEPSS